MTLIFLFFLLSADFKHGESQTPAKRETKSIRLSRFAAHNAFHHCEQCHHYCEAGPATQVSAVCKHSKHSRCLLWARVTSNIINPHTYMLTCQNTVTLKSMRAPYSL